MCSGGVYRVNSGVLEWSTGVNLGVLEGSTGVNLGVLEGSTDSAPLVANMKKNI